MSTCAAVHFGLTLLLLDRKGYLNPRHLLVIVMLGLPFAAIFLDHLLREARGTRRRVAALVFAVACVVPLAFYALRVPNGTDAHLRRAAEWLRTQDPAVSQKTVLGGTIERRIAFYADSGFLEHWYAEPADAEIVAARIVRERPAYLAVETGGGFDRQGNDRLIEALRNDPRVGPLMRELHTEDGVEHNRLWLFGFEWADE
jgi:hypothetical protein